MYFSVRGYRTDAILESLAPQVREIENNASIQGREKRSQITALLKGRDIDPLAEIWAVLGQVIFLIGLYQVIQTGFGEKQTEMLYSFVSHPQSFNTVFYGFDLARTNVLLSAIASGVLFLELVLEYNAKKDVPRATVSEKWFPIILPIFTFLLLVILPSAKALFILTSVLFSLVLRAVISMAIGSKKKYVR